MHVDEGLLLELLTTTRLSIPIPANCIAKVALLRTQVVCFFGSVGLTEPHGLHDLLVPVGLQTAFLVKHFDGALLLA